MPTLDNLQLRQIIMEHYQHPRNFKSEVDSSFVTYHMDHTDSCIDDIYIHVKVVGGVIKECYWNGKACAISTASTSILTELVTNKTLEQFEYLLKQFNLMMDSKDFDEEALEDAICFINTPLQPSRINCATIGWRGLENALKNILGKEKENV